MNYLGQNIKFLRKEKQLTQEKLANKLGITRSLIGAYEEGRTEPKLQTIMAICHYFDINIDLLVNFNLSQEGKSSLPTDLKGDKLRILPIIVDKTEEEELSVLVPIKASAGYTKGYGDIDYIESLPKFNMPYSELSNNRSYRLFQIAGDSMLPIPPNAYIICEYLQDWTQIKNEQSYILVSKNEGIVYKRIINNSADGYLLLKSDNPEHQPYSIPIEEVLEVWKALGYTTFDLPEINPKTNYTALMDTVMQLKTDVERLKQKVGDR